MLLAACALPHTPDGRQLDWSDVADRFFDRVEQLDDGTLAVVAAALQLNDESADPKHVRSCLVDAAHRLFADLAPLRRDVAIARFGGIPYLCTGGMSWGDPPTDAFEDMLVIQVSGVTDKPFYVP